MMFFFPLGFQQHWRLEISPVQHLARFVFFFNTSKRSKTVQNWDFFSKTSRVSFQSTEEQIGVSDTDDSVSEASMATDETGGMTIEVGFQMISVEKFKAGGYDLDGVSIGCFLFFLDVLLAY